MSAERQRLSGDAHALARWRKWGPYLSDRAWGTVREDYSANGDAWSFLPHDLARSKAYRWGEDGIAGFSDRYQILCWSMAFWNERDPILKERPASTPYSYRRERSFESLNQEGWAESGARTPVEFS